MACPDYTALQNFSDSALNESKYRRRWKVIPELPGCVSCHNDRSGRH